MYDTGDDRPRFVIDESTLDFRGMSVPDLEENLEEFVQTVLDLTLTGETVAASALVYDTECDEDLELWKFCFPGQASSVPRDTLLRLQLTLDRCPTWDPDIEGLDTEVTVDGTTPPVALSVGYALHTARNGHNTACVVFAGRRRGWLPVHAGEQAYEVYFLHEPDAVTLFWRALFARENIPEARFMELARSAFPQLVLAPSLTFRNFSNPYLHLRDWVVHTLSVINDHFPQALQDGASIPAQVQAALGHHGVTLSPESPKTRANSKAMAQRDVPHGDDVYRCEWHAKKEPTRDRVHFSLPDERLGGRILVGIFVDHLDT
ncbi:hypothetical protein [Nocardiopsis synnemataformans]|uniref:hypothetical protein n=1 Tax=Nocardiopsis synnemataformans TaxID=61305 RepID=UPI003EB7360B